jgi:hypothetical protein
MATLQEQLEALSARVKALEAQLSDPPVLIPEYLVPARWVGIPGQECNQGPGAVTYLKAL